MNKTTPEGDIIHTEATRDIELAAIAAKKQTDVHNSEQRSWRILIIAVAFIFMGVVTACSMDEGRNDEIRLQQEKRLMDQLHQKNQETSLDQTI